MDEAGTVGHSRNAFDFLRVAAASAVLLSHSFVLYGLREPSPIGGYTLGTVAVFVFFAISGFLVCQSWERDPNLYRFAIRRALRVLPGLFVAVLFATFVIGAIASTLPIRSFLASPDTWSYFVHNASLRIRDTLPGVFETNPFRGVVNGSLWTLPVEVFMYVLLAALGLFARDAILRFACVATFFVCLMVWGSGAALAANGHSLPLPVIWRFGLDGADLAELGTFFFGSSSLYLLRSKLALSPSLATLLGVACVLAPNGVVAKTLIGECPDFCV